MCKESSSKIPFEIILERNTRMNKLSIRFTLDKLMINESKEFQAKVYESVEQLFNILRVEELSYETLGLIIMLEKINEKQL